MPCLSPDLRHPKHLPAFAALQACVYGQPKVPKLELALPSEEDVLRLDVPVGKISKRSSHSRSSTSSRRSSNMNSVSSARSKDWLQPWLANVTLQETS